MMNRKMIFIFTQVAVLALVMMLCVGEVQGQPWDGSGTAEEPYPGRVK